MDISSLWDKDVSIRQAKLGELLNSLRNNPECLEELSSNEKSQLVAILVGNIGNSNIRVSHPSIDALQMLTQTLLISHLKNHIADIIASSREKLADSSESVRSSSSYLLISLMLPGVSNGAQEILEIFVMDGLKHRHPKVREETLKLIVTSINMYQNDIKIAKYIPMICDLLSDCAVNVRTSSADLLLLLYTKYGQKVKADVEKASIHESKKKSILQQFELALSQTISLSVPQAFTNLSQAGQADDPISLESTSPSLSIPMISIDSKATPPADTIDTCSLGSEDSGAKSLPTYSTPGHANNCSKIVGALSTDEFEKAFQSVAEIYVANESQVDSQITYIIEQLDVESDRWDQRVKALKDLRGIVKNCTPKFSSLYIMLRRLDRYFEPCIKDLRSQVVREVCITLAYLSTQLKKNFDKTFDFLLPKLISGLNTSIKIMNSSYDICIQYCIVNTPFNRILPTLCKEITSKATIIKKHCSYYMFIALSRWQIGTLRPHEILLVDTLKKSLADADQTCREHSRNAFLYYNKHFPQSANKVLMELDINVRKKVTSLMDDPPSMADDKLTSKLPTIKKNVLDTLKNKISPRNNGVLNMRNSTSATDLRAQETKQKPKQMTDFSNMPFSKDKGRTLRPPSAGGSSNLSSSKKSLTIGRCSSAQALSKIDYEDIDPTKTVYPFMRNTTQRGSLRTNKSRPSLENVQFTTTTTPIQPRKMLVNRSATLGPGASLQDAPREDKLPKRPPLGGGMGSNVTPRSKSVDLLGASSTGSNSRPSSPVVRKADTLSITEAVACIKSTQYTDKKNGIESLQSLITSNEYTFSTSDAEILKEAIKSLFSESNQKLYSMFLEMLADFLNVYSSFAENWLNLILLRILHKLGTDNISSIRDKLQRILTIITIKLPSDRIFKAIWRVLNDATQPMGMKTKQTSHVFLKDLTNHADQSDFVKANDSIKGFESLVKSAQDNKPELNKSARNALKALFILNPATFTLMIDDFEKIEQNMLNGLMKSASEEEITSPTHSTDNITDNDELYELENDIKSQPIEQIITEYGFSSRRVSEPAIQLMRIPINTKETQLLTPTAPAPRRIYASSANNAFTNKTGIPAARDYPNTICHLPLQSTKSLSRSTNIRQLLDPNTTSHKPLQADPIKKPLLVRSQPVSPVDTSQGCINIPIITTDTSIVKNLARTDWPTDNFEDSPDSQILDEPDCPLLSALSLLETSPSCEERKENLITLTQQVQCATDMMLMDNLDRLLTNMFSLIKETGFQMLAVKILREILKRNSIQLKNYTTDIILCLLELYNDPRQDLSRGCEDLFCHLHTNIDQDEAFHLLLPKISIPANSIQNLNTYLGAMKMMHKVVTFVSSSNLQENLSKLFDSLVQNYNNSNSTVRKASLFVIVAIHGIVGDTIHTYLGELTPAQSKLLKLYIDRSKEEI